jgi:hypothetical protein
MTPDEMTAEADRLVKIQREARGSEPCKGLDGKPSSRPGPYDPSPENEQRAAQIVSLRRRAARQKFPINRPKVEA